MAIVEDGQTYLTGDGTWPFRLLVDGADLVCESGYCTNFGGNDDPMDNGLTASGVVTKNNPYCRGCALPMEVPGNAALEGSPVPEMPFLATFVRIFCPANGKQITVPIIDRGPGKGASSPGKPHVIDLTQQSYLDLMGTLDGYPPLVRYRILGGAKYAEL